MPIYRTNNFSINISRNATLLDTNILVAAYDKSDSSHDEAIKFLSTFEGQILLFTSVIVEAWGVLCSSKGKKLEAWEMLQWINTPGNVEIIPHEILKISDISAITQVYDVDFVDATLLRFANEISNSFQFSPPLRIFTTDTRDFLKCISIFKICLIDPKTGEDIWISS